MRALALAAMLGAMGCAGAGHDAHVAPPTIVIGSAVPQPDPAVDSRGIPPWPCPTQVPDAIAHSVEHFAQANIQALLQAQESGPARTGDVHPAIREGMLLVPGPYGEALFCIFVQAAPSGQVVTLRYFQTVVE